MATSSQYHAGASTQASHYPQVPSNDDHLYASLATSWHGPPLSQAPGSSALLQRFSAFAQRPYPSHFFQYGGTVDYVNPHARSEPSWAASDFRHGPQDWSLPLSNGGFQSRAIAYGAVDGRTPVPQTSPRPAPQHQRASNPSQPVLLSAPGNACQQESHLAPELSAPPNAPSYPPRPLSSAPVARLLNYPNTELHALPPHASSQAPVSWPAGSSSGVSTASPPHRPTHAGNALSSDLVLPSQGSVSRSEWDMLHSTGSTAASPVYERVSDADPTWPSVEAQPTHDSYMHHHSHEEQFHGVIVAPQGGRRAFPKKSVARVPASYVERQEKVKVSKRKGPLDQITREKTHRMRKEKNGCLRCRFYKSGCDDGDPCKKCRKIEGNARSFKQPCTRDRLEDAILVRHCNGRSNQEEGEFLNYDWMATGQIYEMEILWNLPGYGPIAPARPIRVMYRSYRPTRPVLDTATSVWSNTNGEVKVVEQPPYAIWDTASFMPSFERYFSEQLPTIEGCIFDRVRQDELAMLTYHEVMRVRQKSPAGSRNLLDLAMRLQCLSIVSQGYGTVSSNNIPGIQEYDFGKMGQSDYEAYNRRSRERPLPGAINHQMDVAALKYLKKLERLCMKELGAQIFKPKVKPWHELLLTFFVIFYNLEYIHRGAEKYMISKSGTIIQTHVTSVVSNQIKKWEWAFQVLMQHWAAILRGYLPFKLARENPQELREKGHLDEEGFQYVMNVANIFARTGPDQYPPPTISSPATISSLSSEWIRALFKEAGA